MTNPMQNKSPEERQVIAAKGVATRRANIEAREKARQEAIIYANGLREQIEELESRLSSLQRIEAMTVLSSTLTGKVLLREEEIAKAAAPWNKACGVYFLLDGEEVVYIGQSVSIYSRIAQHQDKNFDRFAFVPCRPNELDVLESLYIHCLRPRMNGDQRDGAKLAPVSLPLLLRMTG